MSTASSQLYRIVFNGEVNRGHDVTHVKRNLSELFRTDAEIIDQLFSGRPVVLKQGLEAEAAIGYLSAMSQAGAVSRMEPMSAEEATKAEAGFIERREAERRREADRRNRLRHESLMPDRRTTRDRRELDNA